jgi:trehalose-phosphatase
MRPPGGSERPDALGQAGAAQADEGPGTLWARWGALAGRLAMGPLLACFDYDGTLVPIRPSPEEAVVDGVTLAAVHRLANAPGVRMVAVSGRPVAQLSSLLPVPRLWRVGLHGLEVAPPGGTTVALRDLDECALALEPLRRAAAAIAARHDGVRVEDKGATLALHTRLASREDAATASASFQEAAADLPGFGVMCGKEVLEVRPEGAHKGAAVARLRAAGEMVLYVGDDLTDEDAFRTLDSDPRAVTVRVGGPGPTAARFRLDRQGEVPLLLDRLAALR